MTNEKLLGLAEKAAREALRDDISPEFHGGPRDDSERIARAVRAALAVLLEHSVFL